MAFKFNLLNRTSNVATNPGSERDASPGPSGLIHHVSGRPLAGPYPEGMERAVFGMGCFWGAERLFWQLEGVWVTAVGYSGGHAVDPTYYQVCSGATGHAETVLVIYDPSVVRYEDLLCVFWEAHDPTQGMRQGNDVGSQYRSVIETHTAEQMELARQSRDAYHRVLSDRGFGPITTEVVDAGPFYFAEPDHQQYLSKNPAGYCGLAGTGVSCPAP